MAFMELSIGMSSLHAAQKGLLVTSNNISNASTPGYARQKLNQQASRIPGATGNAAIGTGVTTGSTMRIRDAYIDAKIWRINDRVQEYEVKTAQSIVLEDIVGNTTEGEFLPTFSSVFDSINELMKTPDSMQNKVMLQQSLQSFTTYFNQSAKKLEGLQKEINNQIKEKLEEVNRLSSRIQSLNEQIYESERMGNEVNNLKDERDLCIDNLSGLVNIEVSKKQIKDVHGVSREQIIIKANGQTLVDHNQRRTLELKFRTEKKNKGDIEGLYDIQWSDGIQFNCDQTLSGELKGLLDLRDGSFDGDGNGYAGIPYYINKLDEFVLTYATKVNEIYDTTYEKVTGQKITMGKYQLFDATKLTAKEFTLTTTILEDATMLRTNYGHSPYEGDNEYPGANDLLQDLMALKTDKEIFGSQTPEGFMTAISSKLAMDTQEVKRYAKNNNQVMTQLTNLRLSTMQVDTNEEFMLLTAYQQAYQNAAKVISTMDKIYETTIYKLGNW